MYGLAALGLTIGIVVAFVIGASLISDTNPINVFQIEKQRACRAQPEGCLTAGTWSASMIPYVFAIGEPQETVTRRLRDAGYNPLGDNSFWRGGGSTYPCNHSFYVTVAFDDAGGLISATSQGGNTCL